MYDAMGRQNGKEPLICWLWGLEADFMDNDEYLLSLMHEFCSDSNDKDLTQLADEVLEDRRKYMIVKARCAARCLGRLTESQERRPTPHRVPGATPDAPPSPRSDGRRLAKSRERRPTPHQVPRCLIFF